MQTEWPGLSGRRPQKHILALQSHNARLSGQFFLVEGLKHVLGAGRWASAYLREDILETSKMPSHGA